MDYWKYQKKNHKKLFIKVILFQPSFGKRYSQGYYSAFTNARVNGQRIGDGGGAFVHTPLHYAETLKLCA